MNEPAFLKLLESGGDTGLPPDDVLAAVLPLFRQVAAWHEQSLVAPLNGLARLAADETGALRCEGTPLAPQSNPSRVEELQRPPASALRVIGQARVTSDE